MTHRLDGTPINLVWRNMYQDEYKISEGFKDVPLELSYFLLTRTRERILFENRMQQDNQLLSGRWFSKYT